MPAIYHPVDQSGAARCLAVVMEGGSTCFGRYARETGRVPGLLKTIDRDYMWARCGVVDGSLGRLMVDVRELAVVMIVKNLEPLDRQSPFRHRI